MIYLVEFSPILPDFGIVFWTFLVFLLVWSVLGRYAFRPIQNALKKREVEIQGALDQAKQAREDMMELQSKNENLLKEAQEERTKILKEAKETSDRLIKEARDTAKKEAQKVALKAQEEIANMKKSTMAEVRNELGNMAIAIAEKVVRQKLAGDKAQEDLVKDLVEEIKLN